MIKASKAAFASSKATALAALEEREEAQARLEAAQKAHQKAKERHQAATNPAPVSITMSAGHAPT